MGADARVRYAQLVEATAAALEKIAAKVRERAGEDICGLCGKPGANKMAAPVHWPGENAPDTDLVHTQCEEAECRRAHAALTDKQRADFLRWV